MKHAYTKDEAIKIGDAAIAWIGKYGSGVNFGAEAQRLGFYLTSGECAAILHAATQVINKRKKTSLLEPREGTRFHAAEEVVKCCDDLIDWGDVGMPDRLKDAIRAWRDVKARELL